MILLLRLQVPTLDSVRSTYLARHLLVNMDGVLCIGPTGTGKTLGMQDLLMKKDGMPEKFVPLFIQFSAQTSANQTQDILDAKMDKRRLRVYGAPAGKKMVVFVDDLNMPKREKYFAQPPIELLRQWHDHSGWYNRKELVFHEILDICFTAAMGPPGGGRNPVTNRLLRHLNHIAFVELEHASLHRIFAKILDAFVATNFAPAISPIVDPMVYASIDVFDRCIAELLPTPDKSFYTFNLRDLAKLFQGVLMVDPRKIGEDPAGMIRLWIHESMRVFRDRLVNDKDRAWFDSLMRELVKSKFNREWSSVVTEERIIFGDYMVQGEKNYCEVTNLTLLRTQVETYLEDYNNETTKKMKLVMFFNAIEHVSRISRVRSAATAPLPLF